MAVLSRSAGCATARSPVGANLSPGFKAVAVASTAGSWMSWHGAFTQSVPIGSTTIWRHRATTVCCGLFTRC